jgi:hypothetical protein
MNTECAECGVLTNLSPSGYFDGGLNDYECPLCGGSTWIREDD